MIEALLYCLQTLYQTKLKCYSDQRRSRWIRGSFIQIKSDLLALDFIMTVIRLHGFVASHVKHPGFGAVNEMSLHNKPIIHVQCQQYRSDQNDNKLFSILMVIDSWLMHHHHHHHHQKQQ